MINKIYFFRLVTLKAGLKLEVAGLKKRGQSVYSMVKSEFGFKGNKKEVLDQLCFYIEKERLHLKQ